MNGIAALLTFLLVRATSAQTTTTAEPCCNEIDPDTVLQQERNTCQLGMFFAKFDGLVNNPQWYTGSGLSTDSSWFDIQMYLAGTQGCLTPCTIVSTCTTTTTTRPANAQTCCDEVDPFTIPQDDFNSCQAGMHFGKTDGIINNPEWYPDSGLSSDSSWLDWQTYISGLANSQGCLPPCGNATACNAPSTSEAATTTPPSGCYTEVDPDTVAESNRTQCQAAIRWNKYDGFPNNTEWYTGSGLTNQSSWYDWQLYKSGQEDPEGCLTPCCLTEVDPDTVAESDRTPCQAAIRWNKYDGFPNNPEWYTGSGLTSQSSWYDWQMYKSGQPDPEGCFPPCAATTTQATTSTEAITTAEATTTPQATNLALGKPSSASSAKDAHAKAFDGDMNSRWESDWLDNQWLSVDLVNLSVVVSIDISWEGACAESYQMEGSVDGLNWTTIYTVSGMVFVECDDPPHAVNGIFRHLRMYGLTRTSAYGFSIYEISVMGYILGTVTTTTSSTNYKIASTSSTTNSTTTITTTTSTTTTSSTNSTIAPSDEESTTTSLASTSSTPEASYTVVGIDGACRGTSINHNPSSWHYKLQGFAGSLEDCKALCLANVSCLAIEYATNHCEIWTQLPEIANGNNVYTCLAKVLAPTTTMAPTTTSATITTGATTAVLAPTTTSAITTTGATTATVPAESEPEPEMPTTVQAIMTTGTLLSTQAVTSTAAITTTEAVTTTEAATSYFGSVFITSHLNQQLQDFSGVVQFSVNKQDLELWTIVDAGGGTVFITSHLNQQLQDNNGTVELSSNKHEWEKWTITDAGDGKVFITSYLNKQLYDNNGVVGLSSNKHEWEKWTIVQATATTGAISNTQPITSTDVITTTETITTTQAIMTTATLLSTQASTSTEAIASTEAATTTEHCYTEVDPSTILDVYRNDCQKAIFYAKTIGVVNNPEWYTDSGGLTAEDSYHDWQMYISPTQGCLPPCPITTTQAITTSQAATSCHIEVDPDTVPMPDFTTCQAAMHFGKYDGSVNNPEWYTGTGLTTSSSWWDWQMYVSSRSDPQGCLPPCTTTTAVPISTTTTCYTEVAPDTVSRHLWTPCQSAIHFGKYDGIINHPDWYAGSGLTTNSSWYDWQMYKFGEPDPEGCLAPCPAQECDHYMATAGCDWTKDHNCPGQPAGAIGAASDDNSFGYKCCCTFQLWQIALDEAEPEPNTIDSYATTSNLDDLVITTSETTTTDCYTEVPMPIHGDYTAVASGDTGATECQHAILFAKHDGIHNHPGWYAGSGLTSESSWYEWQHFLYSSPNTNACDEPCPTTATTTAINFSNGNVVTENAPGVGTWGGSCECPDGHVYYVGDLDDSGCATLACFGGISGPCFRRPGIWQWRRVDCKPAPTGTTTSATTTTGKTTAEEKTTTISATLKELITTTATTSKKRNVVIIIVNPDAEPTPISGHLIFNIAFDVQQEQVENAARLSLSIHFDIDSNIIHVVARVRQSRRLQHVAKHARRLSRSWHVDFDIEMPPEKLAAASEKVQDPSHEDTLVDLMQEHFVLAGVPNANASISLVDFKFEAAVPDTTTTHTTSLIGASLTSAMVGNAALDEGDASDEGGGSMMILGPIVGGCLILVCIGLCFAYRRYKGSAPVFGRNSTIGAMFNNTTTMTAADTNFTNMTGTSTDLFDAKGIIPPMPTGKAFHFFLSHKKTHSVHGNRSEFVALNLHDMLEGMGWHGFFDIDNLKRITKEDLIAHVQESCAMIVVLSDETCQSEWCRLEWEVAVEADLPIACVVDLSFFSKPEIIEQVQETNPNLLRHQMVEYTDKHRKGVASDCSNWLQDAMKQFRPGAIPTSPRELAHVPSRLQASSSTMREESSIAILESATRTSSKRNASKSDFSASSLEDNGASDLTSPGTPKIGDHKKDRHVSREPTAATTHTAISSVGSPEGARNDTLQVVPARREVPRRIFALGEPVPYMDDVPLNFPRKFSL